MLKIMEGQQDYLSCKIQFSTDNKRAWLLQSHLIKNLDNKFGECIKDVCSHKTPGMPTFLIVMHMVEREKISEEDQQEYSSGVGMLLYLMKYLYPGLAKVTRELLKANNVPPLLQSRRFYM